MIEILSPGLIILIITLIINIICFLVTMHLYKKIRKESNKIQALYEEIMKNER